MTPAGYLIDTNVVSELRKGARANVGVQRWFFEHADDDLWLSVLVIGELRRGAALLRRRDADAGTRLMSWVDEITTTFADRLVPITTSICERWAELNVPDPLPVIDGLLAATAVEHDLVLVTRNVADIDRVSVEVHNPFN